MSPKPRLLLLALLSTCGIFACETCEPGVTIAPQPTWVLPSASVQFQAMVDGKPVTEGVGFRLEPARPELGSVTAAGLYQAPATVPAANQVTLRAELADGRAATHAFRLGDVTLTVEPEEAEVGVNKELAFSATAVTVPDGIEELRRVTWLVEGKEGGSAVTGTIDEAGRYRAPAAVPPINPVRVTARSRALEGRSAEALVTVVAAGGESLKIQPRPKAVAVREQVTFKAEPPPGAPPEVIWLVNGVEGGSAASGRIDASGQYQAPPALAGAPTRVEVEARLKATPALRGKTSFLLVALTAAPEAITGNKPGQRFPVNVSAAYSDGTTEAVTQLATTEWRTVNPAVAVLDGSTLVLGPEAGLDFVEVKDTRFSPPPRALVQVTNRPDYALEVEPAAVKTAVMGSRHELQIFLVADRGPEKGDRQDISFNPTLEMNALDGNGLVVAPGKPAPLDPQAYVAYLDQGGAALVVGAKPGEARFLIKEPATGKSAQVTVRLVAVQAKIVTYRTDDYGDTNQPCAPGELSRAQVFPEQAGDVPHHPERAALIAVRFSDPSGQLGHEELAELLTPYDVTFQDLTGNGRFLTDIKLMAPDPYQPGSETSLAVTPGGELWIKARAARLPRQYVSKQAFMPTFDSKLTGFAQIFSEVHFLPATYGVNTVRITASGLSESAAIAPPSWTVDIQGDLPALKLDPAPSSVGPSTVNLVGTRQFGVRATWALYADPTLGDTLSHSYDLTLRGKRPDGTPIPAGDIVAVVQKWGQKYFLASFAEHGTYQLWLESKDYPAARLGPPISFQVSPYPAKPNNVTFKIPDLRELLTTGIATGQITFHHSTGRKVPALPLPNTLCASRTHQPVRAQPHMSRWCTGNCAPSDGGRTVVMDNRPSFGQVRYLLTSGQAQESYGHVTWAPEVGSSTLTFRVEMLTYNGANLAAPMNPFLPESWDVSYVEDSCQADANGLPIVEYSESSSLVHQGRARPLGVTINPSTLLLPEQVSPTSEVLLSLSVAGEPLESFAGTFKAADLAVLDEATQAVASGVRVADLIVEGPCRLRVVLGFDQTRLPELARGYLLRGKLGGIEVEHPLAVGLLRVLDRESDGTIAPIALNARPAADRLPGTGRLRLYAVAAGAVNVYGPAAIRLSVSSPLDQPGFALAGFARRTEPSPVHGGVRTTVSTTRRVVFDSLAPAGAPVDPDRVQTVELFGNLTDEKLVFEGTEQPTPDLIPDVASQKEGDVQIRLHDYHGQQAIDLAATTALVFEARRPAELRHTTPELGAFASRDEALAKINWPQIAGAPTQTCAPLGALAPVDPNRDVFLHLDNGHSSDGWGCGMADQRFLTIDGAPVPQDGRVHTFPGEAPVGRPAAPAGSAAPGWKRFGLELDGVCYDPSYWVREEPNSPALFSFAAKDGYRVPLVGSAGLVPGVGGASGGELRTQDGAFSLLARTPGVDFPGLDCGFLAEGSPRDLSELTLPDGTRVPIDTFERVTVEQSMLKGDLDGDDPNRRVFSFARLRDSKETILSGLQTRGKNSAFLITTRPARADGTPLLTTRLKADLLVGEWPYASVEEDGILLTARVDPAVRVYETAAKWLVPIVVAAVTGAVGAWLEASALLGGVGINVLVALTFTAADQLLNLSFGATDGAVMATGTGKAAGKVAPRLIKILRSAIKLGQGATQTVVRGAVNETLFKPTVFAQGLSLGQDIGGGIYAVSIVKKLTEALNNQWTVGNAEGFVFDQLWVSLPQDSLVGSWQGRARSFVTGGLRLDRLSGLEQPTEEKPGEEPLPEDRRRLTKVPATGSSEAYLRLRSKGPSTQLMLIQPDSTAGPTSQAAAWCGQDSGGQVTTADFRLQVGGASPTIIPYVRTSIVGARRNTEEATVRVATGRRGTSVRLFLKDAVMTE